MSDQPTPKPKFYWQVQQSNLPPDVSDYCESHLGGMYDLKCSRGTLLCFKRHPEEFNN